MHQESIEQEPEEEMQSAIKGELLKMIAKAKALSLIPSKVITEIEFTLDKDSGLATRIEYWPTSLRLADQKIIVDIPPQLRNEFVTVAMVRALKGVRGD